ncbi:MAG TPA: sigma-70 family RNA polymerase sigma factor [Arenimonas sp.]|nr:sigma-70 family RNA polymerase sigma factor [Arenimonas sp.]
MDSEKPGVGLRLVASDGRRVGQDAHAEYAELLQRIAAGERAAEAILLQRLNAPLGAVLRRHAHGSEGVDDLRQEALLVVLESARHGRLQDPTALVDYALETARRLALNAERKQQRQRTDVDADAIDSLPDNAPGASERLRREQLQHCVEAVLANLSSERDRQLLYGYYLDERPSAELQARFALDSTQLSRLLHRARQRFKALWHSLELDTPDL